MRRHPTRVVHLFSQTEQGFLPRLWLHQLLCMDRDEFKFSLVLPDRSSLGNRAQEVCLKENIEIHEIPALAQLKNPIYALRSSMSLRRWFPPESVDVFHTHFPGAAVAAATLKGTSSGVGLVHSFYSSVGEWKTSRPPRILRWALQRAARRAERILIQNPPEEARLLDLEIGKKYQMARIPLAIPSGTFGATRREDLVELLGLPADEGWVGVFLPSSSRREMRDLLMELVPLSDTRPPHSLICLLPAGRLSEARTLSLRLRLSNRFHFMTDLNRWDELVPELRAAVLPTKGLVSTAAAQIALSGGCPVWIRADNPWVDFLPPGEGKSLCLGQAYRLKEETESLLSEGQHAEPDSGPADPFAGFRVGAVAAQLRLVYLDVLAERRRGSP